ncbi:MAG: U32 family peptidase [Anaerobutyricum soehngenii]
MEVFVHGALCYCYSGQCLLSSMYGRTEVEIAAAVPSLADCHIL